MTNYDHLPPIPTVYGITIMSFSLSFFIFLNSQIKLFSRSQKTLQPQNVESKTSKNSNGNGTSFHHNNNACTNSNIRQRMEASKEDGYISSDHLKNESNNHDRTHPPTSTSNHKDDENWKWRNLFISWTHALIVGIWDLTCFYYYPELVTDLIAFNNLYIYSLVAFSTGYFIYDTLEILWAKRIDQIWEVVPHHAAVVSTFFYNVVDSFCVSYCVVALLTEVNTVFLHTRKLLQLHGFHFDHWLYRTNSFINLVTFVCCRFMSLIWVIAGTFRDQHRIPVPYKIILSAALFVMSVTNVLLFWRLFKSDVIRPLITWNKRRSGSGCSTGSGGSGGGKCSGDGSGQCSSKCGGGGGGKCSCSGKICGSGGDESGGKCGDLVDEKCGNGEVVNGVLKIKGGL